MKKWWILLILLVPVFGIKMLVTDGPFVQAQDNLLKMAPEFSAKGHDGKTYKLSDFKGKYVVLEWFNNRCPFVDKHYATGNMQALQKKYTEQGVVWLTVASSGLSKNGKPMQGFLIEGTKQDKKKYPKAKTAAQIIEERGSHQTAILLDADAGVAKKYRPTTTPHMFVIDPNGNIIYQGAIDDQPSFKQDSVKGARNYVAEALDISLGKDPKRKQVEVNHVTPYGCGIKNDLGEKPTA